MKAIFAISLAILSLFCKAQNPIADKLYDQGVVAYTNMDFVLADSLFTLSAEMQPNMDIYYNLALVKLKLGNQCESCKYLDLAGEYGDTKAGEMFEKHCFKKDSVEYDNHSYYCLYRRHVCDETILFSFFFKRASIGSDSVVILNMDSALTNEDYLSKSFEIEKYIDTVVLTAETQPEFPGGEYALMEFLGRNIKYPQYARENGIQGTVVIQYIVQPDGKITNVEVLRGIGGGCDEEAIRVVSIMPNWAPGKQYGKPVRVEFTLPIRFILQD